MKNEEKQIGQAAGGKIGTGIRLKLFSFLLPLVFLLIALVTWVVTEVTESALRRDLLQRGAAISRVVALSAGHSLLANDPLGLDRLVSETRSSDPDIAFVAVRDASDIVVAHDRVSERGKAYRHVPPLLPLGTFGDTHADEVVRDGRRYIEYTTPISFSSPFRRPPPTNWAISPGTSTGWRRRSSPRRPTCGRKRINWRNRTSAWSASSPRRWTPGTRIRWATPPAWRGWRASWDGASGWRRGS